WDASGGYMLYARAVESEVDAAPLANGAAWPWGAWSAVAGGAGPGSWQSGVLRGPADLGRDGMGFAHFRFAFGALAGGLSVDLGNGYVASVRGAAAGPCKLEFDEPGSEQRAPMPSCAGDLELAVWPNYSGGLHVEVYGPDGLPLAVL